MISDEILSCKWPLVARMLGLPHEKSVRSSIKAMAEKIKFYVPGFKITVEPFLDGDLGVLLVPTIFSSKVAIWAKVAATIATCWDLTRSGSSPSRCSPN